MHLYKYGANSTDSKSKLNILRSSGDISLLIFRTWSFVNFHGLVVKYCKTFNPSWTFLWTLSMLKCRALVEWIKFNLHERNPHNMWIILWTIHDNRVHSLTMFFVRKLEAGNLWSTLATSGTGCNLYCGSFWTCRFHHWGTTAWFRMDSCRRLFSPHSELFPNWQRLYPLESDCTLEHCQSWKNNKVCEIYLYKWVKNTLAYLYIFLNNNPKILTLYLDLLPSA